MDLVTINVPIIIMALLTAVAAIPLAYEIFLVKDLWDRLRSQRPRQAVFITTLATVFFLATVVAIAYFLLAPGWRSALRT